jgi:hypothetical protein
MSNIQKVSLARQRVFLMIGAAVSVSIAAAAWSKVLNTPNLFTLYLDVPPLTLAFQAIAVAALFGPLLAIEAVAHERLATTGIDPLSGYSSASFELDQLFLRGSVEQWILFAAGLLGFSVSMNPETVKSEIVLATVIWIAGRLIFRIGYAFGSEYRGLGMAAYAQSLLILLYLACHWTYEVAGPWGTIIAIVVFASAEIVFVTRALKARRRP